MRDLGRPWHSFSLIDMMCNCSITVMKVDPDHQPKMDEAHRFLQLKVRHNKPLNTTDYVLVFAGNCHYLGACKYYLLFLPLFCFVAISHTQCSNSFCSVAIDVNGSAAVFWVWQQCVSFLHLGAWVHRRTLYLNMQW